MKPTTIDYVFWPAPVRRYSFREHLKAAEAGGFTSLAVAPEAYRQAISSGLSPKDMVTMASDKGVALRHLDTLTDWAPIRVPSEIDAGLRSRFDVSADECFAICEELGLETILAVAGYDKGAIPLDLLVDGFGRLCDRAAQNGLWVDLEFMPFWGLPDLATAWAIVGAAQRKNAGIMVDTWHFSKGNPDFALLKALPGECLVSVQVADAMQAQRGATLFEDTVRFRRFPGEGELPIVEILTILDQKGHLRRIGPEVFSDEADALPPEIAGKRSAESLRRILHAAGIPSPTGETIMTEHNTAIDTLMRFYEAETAYLAPDGGDFRVIAATLDPECVLYQPHSLPYGGKWRGHEGFEKWMQKFGEQWSSLEVKNPELYPSGDVVISRSHVYAVARGTGRRIDWPLLQFFKMRNGKILELRPFHWDTAAMLPAMRSIS